MSAIDSVYTINLDLMNETKNNTMFFQLCDTETADFYISLSRYGSPISETISSATVTLYAIKPNGNSVVRNLTYDTDEGLFYCNLDAEDKNICGTYRAQIVVTWNGEVKATKSKFTWKVEADVKSESEGIAYTPEVDNKLDALVTRVTSLETRVSTLETDFENIANSPAISGTTIYIGDTAPTNGELYWYDTSGSTSDTPIDGGGEGTTTYTITNTLTNCTTNNSITSIDANSSYTATLTANSGYTLGTITVTMRGTNITSTAVSGNVITISSVTGNIVITCTATQQSGDGDGEYTVDVTMTDHNSSSIAWYSDNGSTSMQNTSKAYSYSDVFDVDTEVQVTVILSSTNYGGQYLGCYSGLVTGGIDIAYYGVNWEKDTTYFDAGTEYTATYTVKAGHGLIVCGWSSTDSVSSLVVKAKA